MFGSLRNTLTHIQQVAGRFAWGWPVLPRPPSAASASGSVAAVHRERALPPDDGGIIREMPKLAPRRTFDALVDPAEPAEAMQKAPSAPAASSFAQALATSSARLHTGRASGRSGTALRAASGNTAIDASLPYADLIARAAQRYQVDPALVQAVIQAESGFNPNAVSPAGAQGLMQLMPGTAAVLGVKNPFDPSQNIEGGVKFLSGLLTRFGGSLPLALAGYNAGPGAVEQYGGIPPYPETQIYVRRVMDYHRRLALTPRRPAVASDG